MEHDPKAQDFCNFPENLNPLAEAVLKKFIEGQITIDEFIRSFGLANSDYIEMAFCYVSILTGLPPFGIK